jgi:hypothetical protein
MGADVGLLVASEAVAKLGTFALTVAAVRALSCNDFRANAFALLLSAGRAALATGLVLPGQFLAALALGADVFLLAWLAGLRRVGPAQLELLLLGRFAG